MSTTSKRANLAIRRLEADAPLTKEKIDAFIDANTFPLVEGRRVTFVFRGGPKSIHLQHWIYGLTAERPFKRLPETDLWFRVEELPPQSRIEYKFLVEEDDGYRLIRDPMNPLLAHDPFGANSVCQTEGYEEPSWAEPDPEARIGFLESHMVPSEALGGARRVDVYVPARYRATRRYPLLIVHDGGDYLRFSSLKTVLDNLIHRLEIPPVVAALLYPGDRLVEYAGDERHTRFVADELVPWLDSKLSLLDAPQGRCLLGASLGAVASFATARSRPGLFGRLLLQSGSFAFTDIGPNTKGPVFEPIVELMNAYRDDPVAVTEKLFLSCGTYEPLIYENRSLVPVLQTTGMQIRYVEARDGHNWENWRDRLREGLSWLFPGPLWLVYE